MSYIILSLLLLFTVLLWILFFRKESYQDPAFTYVEHYKWPEIKYFYLWTAALLTLTLIIFGIIVLCRQINYNMTKNGCERYGEQTDRDVRFVDPSYFDYNCYVNWNGTWIPRGQYIRITFGEETGIEEIG